jgi:hypothetical protein
MSTAQIPIFFGSIIGFIIIEKESTIRNIDNATMHLKKVYPEIWKLVDGAQRVLICC